LKWHLNLGVQRGSIVCHELWMFDFYFFISKKWNKKWSLSNYLSRFYKWFITLMSSFIQANS
jgi:hypothetical protein